MVLVDVSNSQQTCDGNKLMVMKFGGSSVKDSTMVRATAEVVRSKIEAGQKPIVVLSAMGKTTNNLIAAGEKALLSGNSVSMGARPSSPSRTLSAQLISDIREHHLIACKELGVSEAYIENEIEPLLAEAQSLLSGIQLIREISPRTRDLLMSFGERLSVRVMAGYLTCSCKVPARAIDAWDAGVATCVGSGSSTDDRGSAEVLSTCYPEIDKRLGHLALDYIYTPVVTGFIAKDTEGHVTTLGRGGSDFSAAILGAAVNAAEIEIWTDVNGILTADPRVVPKAHYIPVISFEEASELAYFGAKVLHPMTILPAMQLEIPVRVKNTYQPSHPGTLIVMGNQPTPQHVHAPNGMVNGNGNGHGHSKAEHIQGLYEKQKVTALTIKKGVSLVDIHSTRMLGQHGFLLHLFEVFNTLGLSIDVIATSEVSVSLTLDAGTPADKINLATQKLEKYANVEVTGDKSIITVICNTRRSTEIMQTACSVFQDMDLPVDMVSCGASKVNISFVVAADFADEALQRLHDVFFPRSRAYSDFVRPVGTDVSPKSTRGSPSMGPAVWRAEIDI